MNRAQSLPGVHEVAQRLSTLIGSAELLRMAAHEVGELFDAESCVLLLPNGSGYSVASWAGRNTPATDHATSATVLRAPLAGGLLEVLNPRATVSPTQALDSLEAVAASVDTAYRRALGRERRRGFRHVCLGGAAAAIALGSVCAAVTTFAHLVWALPLRDLPGRPGIWSAVLLLVLGGILLATARSGTRLLRRSGTGIVPLLPADADADHVLS